MEDYTSCSIIRSYEPRHEIRSDTAALYLRHTCRRWLEAGHFGFRKYMYLCSENKVADRDHDSDHDAAHHLYILLLLQVMDQSLHYEINRGY